MSPEMKKKTQQMLGELIHIVVVFGDLLNVENVIALSLPPSLFSHVRELLTNAYTQTTKRKFPVQRDQVSIPAVLRSHALDIEPRLPIVQVRQPFPVATPLFRTRTPSQTWALRWKSIYDIGHRRA